MVADQEGIISYIRVLKEDLAIFRIKPANGPVPDFRAGQFSSLALPDVKGEDGELVRRAYSIASPPEQKKYFEFYVRWAKKPVPGKLTTPLFERKTGDKIFWRKPTGPFGIVDERPDGSPDTRRIVMAAGGTGLAPFIAFTLNLKARGDKREIIVLHGVSYVDELAYSELLTELEEESIDKGKDHWNFRYRASISRPDERINRSWGEHKGRVETFLKPDPATGKSPLEELVGEKITPENTMFYVCGFQGTVDGIMQTLGPLGFVDEENMREDGTFDVKYESYG
ncbi:MAG: ferredoxin--NADP reductase [Thaumarchaeota archaeon]|nr:ferredoxin--NADP reductase [Nitrososphaerota archaeon]